MSHSTSVTPPRRPCRDVYDASDIDRVRRLLALMAGSRTVRDRLLRRFEEALNEDDWYHSELPIICLTQHIARFCVDWKASDDFIGVVEGLAREWGVPDFRFLADMHPDVDEQATVLELMRWARTALQPHGRMLWHWDTEEDHCCGAISRESDWEEIHEIDEQLGVACIPGDEGW